MEDISEHSSDDEYDLDLDFDQVLSEIETIQKTIEGALAILDRIQIEDSIMIRHGDQDRSLHDVLDEFHAEALAEIEKTGQTTFSTKLATLFS